MQRIAFILVILFFICSCQTIGQDEGTNDAFSIEKNDSIKKVEALKNQINVDKADVAVYHKIIEYAFKNKLETKSLPEIEIEVASQFFGTPYVGHTLEKDSIEALVVNLRELDCTTFLENVMAISLCIRKKTTDFDSFCNMLKLIRYRDGIIDRYPSRLHYTTDWLINNREKGLIELVEGGFGFSDFFAKVNFMSTHTKNYRQLSNPEFVEQIKMHENRISTQRMKYIPKENLNHLAKNIKDGDIIAILTTIPGLDFSHVGMAAWKNGKLHFIHASYTEKKVVFSEKSLYEYLSGIKSNTGIVVARLK